MNKFLIIKGSLTGGLQSIVQILLIFSAIPVFIRLLGAESYGIFCLVASVGNLNNFTNLGLSASLVKHLSEQGGGEESDFDIIVSVLILFALLVSVCTILIIFNRFILLNVMNIPSGRYIDSKWLFINIICGNSLLVLGQLFKAVLDSCEKVYLTNYLQILYNILYWSLILSVLLLGQDLSAVGIAIFSTGFIWFTMIVISALNTWGIPHGKGLKKNFKRIAKKQLGYGGKIFLGGMISFFYEPLLRLLISNFIGIIEVGYFDIGIKIKNQLWGIVSKILYPLYPFIAQINDREKIQFIIQDVEKKILYLSIPFIILFCFTIKPFVDLWLGKDTLIISQTAAVIVSAFFICSCSIIPFYYFLVAKNHPEKTIILQVCNATASSCLFMLTFKWAGYYAALIGSAGGILSSFMISLYYQQRYLKKTIIMLHDLLNLTVICILNISVCFLTQIIISGNIGKLITIPVVVFCITLFLYNRLNIFPEKDIHRYFGESNFLSKYLKKIICKV